MNKKIYVSIVGLTLLGVLTLGTVNAQAFNPQQRITTQLAKKLGISENKVQDAFDAIRLERQNEMFGKFDDRLDAFVKEGKITEAQKELLIKKHTALQKERQNMWEKAKDMTPQERREYMQKEHDGLTAWAKEHNIDSSLFFGFGKRGHMGKKGMMGMWR